MIKKNDCCLRIEEVISKHPEVLKVCVIGIPHPYKMHVPKAIIVLKENANKKEVLNDLKEMCLKELSVYSQPKEYEFRDTLPKTLYGKVDYKNLEKEEETKYNN